MSSFFLGLDLGQASDYSALALAERTETTLTSPVLVHSLIRWPLGTPYPRIIEDVARVCNDSRVLARTYLAVDQTGVGAPVVDLLKRARLGRAQLFAVTITGGVEARQDGWRWYVPKRDLVSAVSVLQHAGRLWVAPTSPLAGTLAAEMQTFASKVSTAGNEQYAAWREGEHDDLVLAVALAGWLAEKYAPQRDAGALPFHYEPKGTVYKDTRKRAAAQWAIVRRQERVALAQAQATARAHAG